MTNIVLVGIQGSGKGTQARKILDKNPNFHFFEMGQRLRDFSKLEGKNPQIVKKCLEEGLLVPMDLIESMLVHYHDTYKDETIVFDGIPRSLEQLELFEKVFDDYFVIFLDLEKEIALERLANRRIDPSNGMSFPADFVGDYSPFTGTKLITRDDDNEEAVLKRIEGFYRNTLPLLAEWAARGKRVYRIDASRSIEEVWETINVIVSAY